MRTTAEPIVAKLKSEDGLIKGQVIKAVAGQYSVKTQEGNFVCSVRGKIKKNLDVFVGDYVETDGSVIEKVYERKNCMIRPYIANLDVLYITVAPVPEPDWNLVEKLLLNCHEQKITPVLIINKCDLPFDRAEMVAPYEKTVKTFVVSALTGENLDELKAYSEGKLVCFCGQSAVGKSTIIGKIGGIKLETGELSRKIQRGKNTTRHIEIYDFNGGQIVDTCGFSVMEGIDIEPEELVYYYDEFVSLQNKCRFMNCTHTIEPNCVVKKAVAEGAINALRYERYVKLYEELKERRKKKYE